MAASILDVSGIGASSAKILAEHGFKTAEDLANASLEMVAAVPGFGLVRGGRVIAAARQLVAAVPAPGKKAPKNAAGTSEKAKSAPKVKKSDTGKDEKKAKKIRDKKETDKKQPGKKDKKKNEKKGRTKKNEHVKKDKKKKKKK